MTSEITELTASELLSALGDGSLSALEVCEAFADRAERLNPQLNAYLRIDRVGARQDAATVDHRREEGGALGSLAGVPLAIKDVMCTHGQPTTCGSRMLEEFIPPYNATVVDRLKQADTILLGKTNMDEFAMGSSTETSALGPTRNPWNLDCVPGGSSGGSAAAVAARLVPWALGSDTGGSIRQPASFTGIVGLKPTYGLVSRYGLVAFASSLDQIGPMARTVEDVALLLQAIAGHDPRDSTSADHAVPHYSPSSAPPRDTLTIGVIQDHFAEGLDTEVESAVRASLNVYRRLGARLVDIELPHSRYGIATYYLIAPSEASSNLARYDGAHYGHRYDALADRETRRELAAAVEDDASAADSALVRMYRQTRSTGFGVEVQRRIMLGTYALSAGYYDAYYRKAQQVRRLIRDDLQRAFQRVDVLAGPVAPTPAFRLGERVDDPLTMYLGDLYTVLANLAGIPAISVPCGMSRRGLPIGLQLQAPPFHESRLLQAAAMYQRATDWHQRRPPDP